MNALESRKQLLIAESEINRAQIAQEWQSMADGVHSITGRARSFTSIAVAAGLLIGGLVAFRRIKSAPVDGKIPWWQALLKGAQLAGSLWSELRARPKS
jgi:hypothetical protein